MQWAVRRPGEQALDQKLAMSISYNDAKKGGLTHSLFIVSRPSRRLRPLRDRRQRGRCNGRFTGLAGKPGNGSISIDGRRQCEEYESNEWLGEHVDNTREWDVK